MKKLVEKIIPKTSNGSNFIQIFSIFVVSLGGLSMGAHFAWPSSSIPQLIVNSSYIGQITLDEASYFPIISSISMLFFSFLVGNAMKYFGRKSLIGFLAVPHIISWILIATAKSIIPIYVARFFNGISEAITLSTIPVYIGEIAVPTVRGSWGNMLMCAIFTGHVVVTVISAWFNIVTTAYILLSVPLVQILLITIIPESPYFLIINGKHTEAKGVLEQLRWKITVDDELSTMTADVNRQISEAGNFKDLFCIRTNRKAILILIGLRTFQQMSGISGFVIYAQYIFQLAGATSISAEVSSITFFSVLTVLSTIASLCLGKCNRKTMLTASSLGCGLSLLIVSIYFLIMEETSLNVSKVTWIPTMGMIFYIASISMGLSLLPTLMTGELLSASIKNHGVFVTSSNFALTVIIVPKILQLLIDNIPLYLVFIFFTFFCFCCAAFSHYYVPETKGNH